MSLSAEAKVRLGMPETIRLELPEAVYRDLLETIRLELLGVIPARLLEAVQAQLMEDVPVHPPPAAAPPPQPDSTPSLRPADEALRQRLEQLLRETSGNVSQAARVLGTARGQIRRWCKRCGIKIDNFRPPNLPPKLMERTSAPTLLSAPAWQPSGLGRAGPAQSSTFTPASSAREQTVSPNPPSRPVDVGSS